MKACLQCEKSFDAKREAAKFCSTNCRVKWNRKNGNKSVIKPFQMQVLYKQMMEAVELLKGDGSLPTDYQNVNKIGVLKSNGEIEPLDFAKMKEALQKEQSSPTFQELLNGMEKIYFSDDKEDYAGKIRAATHLSDKQIQLLLSNLWSKQ